MTGLALWWLDHASGGWFWLNFHLPSSFVFSLAASWHQAVAATTNTSTTPQRFIAVSPMQ